MPKFKDTFLGFNNDDYAAKIGDPEVYPDETLCENIYRKRRQITGGKTSTVGSAVIAVATHGLVPIIGAGLSARQVSVEKQKLELLEAEWVRRGYARLPDRTLKDTALPVAVSGAVGVLMLVAGAGVPALPFLGHKPSAAGTSPNGTVPSPGSSSDKNRYLKENHEDYYDDGKYSTGETDEEDCEENGHSEIQK